MKKSARIKRKYVCKFCIAWRNHFDKRNKNEKSIKLYKVKAIIKANNC